MIEYLIMVFEWFVYYFRTFLKLQEELCKFVKKLTDIVYPLVFQKGMTAAKWYGYPKSQQILSIANELNRAQNALLKGAPLLLRSLVERILKKILNPLHPLLKKLFFYEFD